MSEINSEESLPTIEKPVTRDLLRLAADAGYLAEVHNSIRFADTPLLATEGAALLNIAERAQADQFEKEAEILQGLAEKSDDPRWIIQFAPQAEQLRARAAANRQEADRKEKVIEEMGDSTIPFYLKPHSGS